MIQLKLSGKDIVINSLKCENDFIQALIDKFLKLDYSTSDGNVEQCLANYLGSLDIIQVVKLEIQEDEHLIY